MDTQCISCRATKTTNHCQLCEGLICKKCIHPLQETAFSFFKKIPIELTHQTYCRFCYDEKVAPALESYEEIMERAKKVYIFFVTQKKAIPLLKKSKETLRVDHCIDRDETILRLAFFAAEQSYNAVIQTDVNSKKVREGKYQTATWTGTGIAANIDSGKVDRDHEAEKIYR